jgi:hypothetical protein
MGISTTVRGGWAAPSNSIDNWWRYGNNGTILATTGNNQTWGTNNLIIYVPLRVTQRVVAVKMWYASGSAAATGNVQLGIYDQGGVQLVESSSVAKVGAADEGVVDITDTTIGPGLYYAALWASVSTDTFYAALPAAPAAASMGLRTETNAGGLPATATWAVPQTLAFVPIVGMLLEGTPA